MSMCVSALVYVGVHMFVYVDRLEVNVSFLPLLSTLFSKTKSLAKLKEPLILPYRQASKSQRASFLHFPTPKTTGTHHSVRIL